MPKMTHPFDRSHQVDVPDEKVAVYLGQGWSVKSEQPEPEEITAVTRKTAAPRKTAAKKAAAKKSDAA